MPPSSRQYWVLDNWIYRELKLVLCVYREGTDIQSRMHIRNMPSAVKNKPKPKTPNTKEAEIPDRKGRAHGGCHISMYIYVYIDIDLDLDPDLDLDIAIYI